MSVSYRSDRPGRLTGAPRPTHPLAARVARFRRQKAEQLQAEREAAARPVETA
jgi:hypothetical protein